MRKIKILMAIFLSLFVMVILQSCEKENIEVTEQEPEQEHQEEIITTDKFLEKESGVSWEIKRYWGTYFIEDKYVNVVLREGYCITDVYICSTKARSVSEKISGCVTVPVNLNMGYPDYHKYNIFLVLNIKRYKKGISCVEKFTLPSYSGEQKKPNLGPFSIYYGYRDCAYIPSDRWIYDKSELSFDGQKCNLNRGTDGKYIYLKYDKTFKKEDAIRAICVLSGFSRNQAKKFFLLSGFPDYTSNMNEDNSSPIEIYLGWRRYY
jgi:hypothetical protein